MHLSRVKDSILSLPLSRHQLEPATGRSGLRDLENLTISVLLQPTSKKWVSEAGASKTVRRSNYADEELRTWDNEQSASVCRELGKAGRPGECS